MISVPAVPAVHVMLGVVRVFGVAFLGRTIFCRLDAAVVFAIRHGWFFRSAMVSSCRRQCSRSWCGNPSANR